MKDEFAKKFKCVVADPPWPYKIRGPASSKKHRPNSQAQGKDMEL